MSELAVITGLSWAAIPLVWLGGILIGISISQVLDRRAAK